VAAVYPQAQLTDWQLPEGNRRAKYTPALLDVAIQRSSVVERSAVNRLVVGSNPTAGAKIAMMNHWIYVLQNSDGKLYIAKPRIVSGDRSITMQADRRFESHSPQAGAVAAWRVGA